MLEYFKDLIAYTAWADSEFFRVWKSVVTLREDHDLRVRTDHLVSVQFAFLYAIQDRTYDYRSPDAPAPEILDLEKRSKEVHSEWNDLVTSLSPVDLEKPIRVSWFRNIPVQPTYGEAIMQAVMHTQHHRAQNMATLAQHAPEKTIVDYIIWVIKGRPAPQWNF
jgi:uncharacterized damage-inducible protein DinB